MCPYVNRDSLWVHFARLNLVSLRGFRDADKMQDHMDKWSCSWWDVGSYMRGDAAGCSGQRNEGSTTAVSSLSAFDLWAVTYYSLQMACMHLAAHCSPRYHHCHLVTSNTHPPVTSPTDRAKSWRVPNCPGHTSVQLGKLLYNSFELCSAHSGLP